MGKFYTSRMICIKHRVINLSIDIVLVEMYYNLYVGFEIFSGSQTLDGGPLRSRTTPVIPYPVH